MSGHASNGAGRPAGGSCGDGSNRGTDIRAWATTHLERLQVDGSVVAPLLECVLGLDADEEVIEYVCGFVGDTDAALGFAQELCTRRRAK